MKKITTRFLIGLTLAGSLLFFAVRMSTTSAEPPAPGLDWVNENLQEYRQTVAVEPESAHKELMQQKVNQLEFLEQQRELGAQNPAPKAANPCDLMPTAEVRIQALRVEGIVENAAAPISPDDFTPGSAWQGWVNGDWLEIYSGAQAANPQQGEVWLIAPDVNYFKTLAAPAESGLLTISSVQGSLFTLTNAAGKFYYLDAAARSFVEGPNRMKSVPEPLPTLMPTVSICNP